MPPRARAFFPVNNDDEGLPWLMVVNRDREHAAWTTLRLRTQHSVISEVSPKSGQLRSVSRDQGAQAEHIHADGMVVSFWLAPAGARLLRLGTDSEDRDLAGRGEVREAWGRHSWYRHTGSRPTAYSEEVR